MNNRSNIELYHNNLTLSKIVPDNTNTILIKVQSKAGEYITTDVTTVTIQLEVRYALLATLKYVKDLKMITCLSLKEELND